MSLRTSLRAAGLHPPGPLKERLDQFLGRPRVQETVGIVRALAHDWREDRVSGLAAEVAFFTMLGLFPALLAVAAVLGSLDSLAGQELAAKAQNAVLSGLDRVFTDEGDPIIATVRELFTERRTGVLTLSVLGALFAAARAFAGVVRALDVAYDLEENRTWFQVLPTATLLALGTIVMAVLALAALVLGPVLGGGQEVARAIGLGDAFATFWELLRAPFAVAVLVAWATALFHFAPDHRTRWRFHVPGAVLAATCWLVVSLGFRLYLRLAANGNQVFGLLGGALTLLLWLYLLGIGLLLGGELNAILAGRRRR